MAGESVVGLEVPNAKRASVNMRTVLDSEEWRAFEAQAQLPLALGMGSGGKPRFLDMAKMPHLLIGGTTGSGKSVCINVLIVSLLLTRTPDQVRMVMIDPKRVELNQYNELPHLAAPVITEPEVAVATLKAVVKEMEQRLQALEERKARSITSYNAKVRKKLPYLLVVVDEMADLMMTTGNEVEQMLTRLAQLGRATGIHLIVATQRPSVNVVTGLIKANFPSRLSFALPSQTDSRTILDQAGAEKLLGGGDMLFAPVGARKPYRIQGAFLSDEEIERVIDHWHEQPHYYLPQFQVEDEPDGE